MPVYAIIITDLEDGAVQVDTRSDVELEEFTDESQLTNALTLGFAATMFLRSAMDLDTEDGEAEPSLELPAGVETE